MPEIDDPYEKYKRAATNKERDFAIFARMPARPHPKLRRMPRSKGWVPISIFVAAILAAGIFLVTMGNEDPAASSLGVGLLAGAVVGAVVLFGDKRIDEASAHRDWSIATRDTLASFKKCRGLAADGLDLYSIDVTDRFLMNASFVGTDLRSTRFLHCNLRFADFKRAKLCNAWMAFCDLSEVDMSRADLSYSTCCYSTFDRADLTRANMTQAALTGSTFIETDLAHARLNGAYLEGANLSTAKGLNEAELDNVHWDKWTLWPEAFVPPRSTTTESTQQ